MANTFGINGAQPQKQTKFAPIYTPRWSSGIWTNRSPLRDATTTRISEKYYGAAGDALIAGSNSEITTRLTLARRPGNPVYDANSYSGVDRFEEFRLFSPTIEQINVMVDQANALYSLNSGVKSLVFAKSSGAGQSYMQSVGNSLYFADGVDNKKWMQTLVTWAGQARWNTPTTPFLSTFFIDPNGNIQQLYATLLTVASVNVTADVLTVTSPLPLTDTLSVGVDVTFPASMTATFLAGTTVTITSVSTGVFTADLVNANYPTTAEASVIALAIAGGTPLSGVTQPTWSTVVPSAANNFQGGLTLDGSVVWVNRGTPVKNWGIVAGNTPVAPVVGSTFSDTWKKFTYYSLPGVVLDSNGNLQQVVTPGTSGTAAPTWKTVVGQTTTDGSVTWKMIQTAASLVWHPNTQYTPSQQLTSVAAASGGTSVYSGNIVGGAANALAGATFLVSGYSNDVNNGSFLCTASTIAQITLQNTAAVAETRSAVAAQQGKLQYVVASAVGTNSLFQVSSLANPTLQGNVSAYLFSPHSHSANVGQFVMTNPTNIATATASNTSLNSLSFFGAPLSTGAMLTWNTVNGAGEITGTTTPFPSFTHDYSLIVLANLNVPVAGQYTFTIKHHDGMFWGIGNGATRLSGTVNNPIGQTVTAAQGFPVFGGTNTSVTTSVTDTFVVNFPTAGLYPLEIDYTYWFHSGQVLDVQCNGVEIANGTPQSGTIQPVWPVFTTTNAPGYASVTEVGGSIAWNNIGPATDFTWQASTGFTLPNTSIVDTNGNIEIAYRTGVTGAKPPTFANGTFQLTFDNPNLIWINQGGATSVPGGTVSTFNGGWIYAVSLVNTLDSTVSNASPVSAVTGNFVGAAAVSIAPGAGLPPPSQIDPQSDFVAVFRSTDGKAQPFLIPGPNGLLGTIPLSLYLVNGFTDMVPDTGLNNLIEAPILQQNTPPQAGAKNLAYYLNRIFYSVGNTVYWTSGSDTPAGNGVNGTSPLNFDSFPSLVKRIVPTTSGALVFTVSDVFVIQGNGTAGNPLQSGVPMLPGIGLLSYNALDVNGAIIGFFSTDNQFIILDPNAGVVHAGFPIADQLTLNNGTPGQAWNPANVYVSWYTSGQDTGWYIGDGTFGWYRMLPTPAPETGYTWCPYATIVGGVKALQSIEVTPGVHKLLLGPTGTGPILARNLNVFQDNGISYPANATIGSAVLAQPGQVAVVSFITAESVNIGTPLTLGLLIDEALPYFKGPFDVLKDWVNDPPHLKPSKSILNQRFWLCELDEAAAMRHMQVQIQWAEDNVQNELLALTVFGGFVQEN